MALAQDRPKSNRVWRFAALDWLGQARIVAYARILGLGAAVHLVLAWRGALGATGSDFQAFWSAGRLALSGHAERAYDLAAMAAVQRGTGLGTVFAWVNPPPFLLFVTPFGALDFAWAWWAWVLVTGGAWFLLARRQAPPLSWPIATYPGAIMAASHAQAGFVTGGLLLAAGQLLDRRPFWAGACIGALVIKPHLAVLLPFALLAGGHWRAICGAVLGGLVLLAASAAVYGMDTLRAYPQSWQVSEYLMRTGDADFFLRQVTPYAAVRALGWGGAAMAVQALSSLAMIVLVWAGWKSRAPLPAKVALVLAATPLATPYLFNYDLAFLIVPTVWLIEQARRNPGPAWERPALLGIYLAPMAGRVLALPLGINLTPVFIGLMVWIVWRRLHDLTAASQPCYRLQSP